MSVSLYGSGQTVLQVVYGSYTTSSSTSSSSYVAQGLNASITPQSTTSKIAIFISIPLRCDGGGSNIGQNGLAIARNGSIIISDSTSYKSLYGYTSSADVGARVFYQYLDSPSSTSSLTYALYWATNSGGTANYDGTAPCTIILMEISGS